MAETAPNKTVSSAGMRPAVVTPNLASTPTHRVKKLLETYHLAAGSMLGPPSTATASELSYSKFYPAFHHQVIVEKNLHFASGISICVFQGVPLITHFDHLAIFILKPSTVEAS